MIQYAPMSLVCNLGLFLYFECFIVLILAVQICSISAGDPDDISKVDGRKEINYLDGGSSSDNLQLLNLM